jgi:hypothetical protein
MNDWYTSKYGDDTDALDENEESPQKRRRRKRHRRSVRETLAHRRRRKRKKERELEEELALLEEEYGDVLVDAKDEEDEEDEEEEVDELDAEEFEYQKRRRRVQRMVNRETLLDISSTLFTGRSKPAERKRPMEARIADKTKALLNGAYGVGLMVLTNDWLTKKDIK